MGLIKVQIDGVIIFDSITGVPLFSKVDESIDTEHFSGFVTAAKTFFSTLSLGGLLSFTTEEKFIFLAARTRVVTAIITSTVLDPKKIYSLAYEITEAFDNKFRISESERILNIRDFNSFSNVLTQLIERKRSTPFKVDDKVIFFYTVDQEGELTSLPYNDQTDLSSYPVLIVVNSLIKQIYVLQNDENISNRILFLAGRAVSNLNRQHWKSEYRIRNISDTLECRFLLDQASNLIIETGS